ncbi:MAG: hypothetical protein HY842_12790 [Bacteroidetes bacterium]|nr:hypothetical protein [Bacteroidota bacterium]
MEDEISGVGDDELGTTYGGQVWELIIVPIDRRSRRAKRFSSRHQRGSWLGME